MNNVYYPLFYQDPNSDPLLENKKEFIEGILMDFLQQAQKHKLDAKRLNRYENTMLDMLYEYVDDNIEQFFPEPTYEDFGY